MMTIPKSCNVLMTLPSFRGGGQKWCLWWWWDVFSLKLDLAWGAEDRTCYFLPRPTKRSWTPVQLSSSSWRNMSILYLVPSKGYVLNRIAGALRSRIHHILIWNKAYIHWWGQWKYQRWTPCPTGYLPHAWKRGGSPPRPAPWNSGHTLQAPPHLVPQ